MKYYLAIDIGASSGRHILCHLEEGRLILEEIFRFDNKQKRLNGHDCWDVEHLFESVLEGLSVCGKRGIAPESVGIDTWGVDFVLLDSEKQRLTDAVAYRDDRTKGMDAEVERTLSFEELYARTGIQKQPYNTVYQLTALKGESPEALRRARYFLMMPEYLGFLLTGEIKNEYTNATTTALVNARSKTWDRELIERLGLPAEIFGELAMPGEALGKLLPSVRERVGFDTTVVLPATHDTGSAYLAVPARDEHAVYLSSGTWSLLGVENEAPITHDKSREENFTNEGGAFYRFRYLKNIMGLWMIQSVRRELNGVAYIEGKELREKKEKTYSYAELEALARATTFAGVVDVNDTRFLAPDSMINEIRAACREAGGEEPRSVGDLMQCIYHSLALCYKNAIKGLSEITGKTYTSLNIVGGGCRDEYLCVLTARETGLAVFAGPTEGTAIGNLLIQMIRTGELADLTAARDAVRKSFDIKEIV